MATTTRGEMGTGTLQLLCSRHRHSRAPTHSSVFCMLRLHSFLSSGWDCKTHREPEPTSGLMAVRSTLLSAARLGRFSTHASLVAACAGFFAPSQVRRAGMGPRGQGALSRTLTRFDAVWACEHSTGEMDTSAAQ